MRSCKFCDRNLENPLSCYFEGIGDKRKYINLSIFIKLYFKNTPSIQ